MIRHRYQKPAIQEAIFEAKFSYDSFDTALPGQIFEKIKQNYSKKKDISLITLVLGSGNNPLQNTPQPAQAPIMQAWKDDDSALVQVGPGIVVANQLIYSSWENFIPGIQEILTAYIDLAKPKFIERLGIRYVNRFVIPEKDVKLSDYFQLSFQIPKALYNVQGFDLTLIHEQNGFEVKTKFMTDSLRPNELGNSFVLDIDCYMPSALEPKPNQIVKLANQAHEVVEEIFENVISDKIRDIMEIKQ